MPRGKHIRTVSHGLYGQPTNLNNVETYANVPWIVRHGAGAFAAKGTATSKGTKIFSLTGKIVNGGLVEVPMGATLREVIFDIGGGMLPGRHFKAVQLGGPSGGCLPESLLDEPIDFESLVAAGSMMGSGGMVVVDDTTCMVDFAKFFLKFTAEESCGKCVPCRIGSQRLLEILERISAGEGKLEDVQRLERLSEDIIEGSLCALGGSAPYPVLSTIRYFRDEIEAHIVDAAARQGLPAAHPLHGQRQLHRLLRLHDGLPDQGGHRRAQEAAEDRPAALHQVRHLSPGLQLRRHHGRDRRAGHSGREVEMSPTATDTQGSSPSTARS